MIMVTINGRLDVDQTNTGGAFTFPRNVDRVLFMFEAPIGQSAIMKISQGSSKYEFSVAPHTVAVIDLRPGSSCGP